MSNHNDDVAPNSIEAGGGAAVDAPAADTMPMTQTEVPHDGDHVPEAPTGKDDDKVAGAAADVNEATLEDLLVGGDVEQLVHEDELVRDFLINVRSIHLGDCCVITPGAMFIITLFIFALPAIWSMCSVLIDAALPPKLFYDGCRNSSGDAQLVALGKEVSVRFPYSTCIACNGDRPFVFTNTSNVSAQSQTGFALIVVVVNVVVTIFATAFFLRLSVKEFTALYMLSHDVLVESTVSCSHISWLILVILMCLFAAAVNITYQAYLTLSTDLIPLGWKDNSTALFGNCFSGPQASHLVAVIDPDNPSLSHSVSAKSTISIVKAVLSASLLYVPVIVKLITQVRALYNSFAITDLLNNSRLSQRIFAELKFSCDYDDLFRTLDDYADCQDGPEDCSCIGCVVRGCSLNWACWKPPAFAWGFLWGQSEASVNTVLTILKVRGELRPYTEEELQRDKDAVFVLNKDGTRKHPAGQPAPDAHLHDDVEELDLAPTAANANVNPLGGDAAASAE